MRGATLECKTPISSINFNPRAPCGARRYSVSTASEPSLFQPTRPLRGATGSAPQRLITRQISTHAPLAGRDAFVAHRAHRHAISTHAPLAGRDRCWVLPCRAQSYFNPRAPCGARLSRASAGVSCFCIFQPTRPLRGATAVSVRMAADVAISTHAPLAGRDRSSAGARQSRTHFNPRAPCGARPTTRATMAIRRYFNPRAPCGARLR